MFDDTSTDAAATSTRINGHPPLLSSALDQVEVAPAAKAAKAVRAAKSPFQSFQAKFSKSPAKPARTTSSPGAGRLDANESASEWAHDGGSGSPR
ncbi:hypothetical protein GN244_ATG18383 [Phytophthora infestans]|uniref:Uncharacterized protein n=1 Tax=Phytophthora infestans TaxID=4787 RepID=A0A833W5X0_PHYIN|nr:hypothetical protein GN244_ATG18383 [Phytophthora infestans]